MKFPRAIVGTRATEPAGVHPCSRRVSCFFSLPKCFIFLKSMATPGIKQETFEHAPIE